MKKLLWEAVSIIAAVVVAFLPQPDGLERNAMVVLGLLLWAIINWIAKTMPDFIVALVMCCMWVLTGIIPLEQALTGFSNSTVWLLVGALGFGTAIAKSGLLSRVALGVMKICPATFSGQVLALIGAGTIIGPFIPSTTAKVSIAGAMSTGIGKQLGFEPRSKGMAGIWCAMYTGFTLNAPIFLTSSFFAYLLLGLLPEKDQTLFTFGYWLKAALPWGIFILIVSFFVIRLMYGPKEKRTISKDEINKELEALGPMKKNEKIVLAVLAVCGFFLVMERTLGVSSTITFLLALCVLMALNVITVEDYNKGISWGLITFAGVVINLGSVLSEVKFDTWISNTFGPYMAGLVGNPYLFVAVVAVAVLLVRFVIVDYLTCFTLFLVILTPFCVDARMSPWIVAFCAYVVCQPWFVKYQNINFLAAYSSAGGDQMINHNYTIGYCLIFHIVAILGLVLSVPYWRFLGLIA